MSRLLSTLLLFCTADLAHPSVPDAVDSLLYNFQSVPLRVGLIERPASPVNVTLWKTYFRNSTISTLASLASHADDSPPFDLIVDTGAAPTESLPDFARAFRVHLGALLAGGLYIQLAPDTEQTVRLLDVQQRGSILLSNARGVQQAAEPRLGLSKYDNVFEGYENEVKSVQISASMLPGLPPIVMFSRKGAIDDSEWMTNGDDGLQYGEARHGLFARTLHRQFRMALEPKRLEYLSDALRLFEMPLTGLEALFRLPRVLGKPATLRLRPDSIQDKGKFETDATEWKTAPDGQHYLELLNSPLEECLKADFEFSLAVPRSRLSFEFLSGDRVVMRIAAAQQGQSAEDYTFLPKLRPWKTWRHYFGPDAAPTPLSVLAQAVREKFAMVSADDDQSNLYRGRCSRAILENVYQGDPHVEITLLSADCGSFRSSVGVHGFSCAKASTLSGQQPAKNTEHATIIEPARRHSILYQLYAKGKLDGYLGVPPVGNHKKDEVQGVPPVRSIQLEGDDLLYRNQEIQGWQDGLDEGADLLDLLAASPGGIGELMDATAGMADQGASLEEQTAGLKKVCPIVAPGGLCLWDCLFPHQEPAPRIPGDVYDTLRSEVLAMFPSPEKPAGSLFEAGTVRHLTFIPGNAALVKTGTLQRQGADAPGLRRAIMVRQQRWQQERRGDNEDSSEEEGEL